MVLWDEVQKEMMLLKKGDREHKEWLRLIKSRLGKQC